MKGGAYFPILIERLVLVQLTSPSGQASPRGTPCPRSRDGLPDRDDVPDNVRLGLPREPRLAMLVS